jgi:hypothetical protein
LKEEKVRERKGEEKESGDERRKRKRYKEKDVR